MENRKYFIVDIKQNIEADGRLLVVEGNSNIIPFEIQRIFWVRDVIEGASRGNHATKKTKLILIPVSGQCDVVVNDGFKEEIFHMDDPTKGLYIKEMIWRKMKNFSPDCVMMAICDRKYEPGNETYENFEEFKKALDGNKE